MDGSALPHSSCAQELKGIIFMKLLRKFSELLKSQLRNNLIAPKEAPYTPQNRLEELMIEAGDDPSARPIFIKQLFHYDLWVLTGPHDSTASLDSVRFRTSTDDKGVPYVYAFTSKAAFEYVVRNLGSKPQAYIKIPAMGLFQMIQGEFGMNLNFWLPVSKIFTIKEIEEISNGGETNLVKESFPAGTRMLIGQPKQYSEELVPALRGYLARESRVSDMYIGMHGPTSGPFSYYLALEFRDPANQQSERDLVFKELQEVLRSIHCDLPVDMTVADADTLGLVGVGSLISLRSATRD